MKILTTLDSIGEILKLLSEMKINNISYKYLGNHTNDLGETFDLFEFDISQEIREKIWNKIPNGTVNNIIE